MIKIVVDTSVWRHWLTLKTKKSISDSELKKDAIAFEEIYKLVSSLPSELKLMYCNRVETELPKEYRTEHICSFEKIKQFDFIEKIPIPLSRHDGTDKYDRSLLYGGKAGGTLRKILNMDGYNHETELKNANPTLKRRNPLHTNPRVKEFDIEHLESALEAEADFFLTNDYKLLERLKRAQEKYSSDENVCLAERMSLRPTEAIRELLSRLKRAPLPA